MGVVGMRFGMLLIPLSIGLLIGDPIAGAISASGWVGLQVFAGTVGVAAAVCALAVRATKHGWKWRIGE